MQKNISPHACFLHCLNAVNLMIYLSVHMYDSSSSSCCSFTIFHAVYDSTKCSTLKIKDLIKCRYDVARNKPYSYTPQKRTSPPFANILRFMHLFRSFNFLHKDLRRACHRVKPTWTNCPHDKVTATGSRLHEGRTTTGRMTLLTHQNQAMQLPTNH